MVMKRHDQESSLKIESLWYFLCGQRLLNQETAGEGQSRLDHNTLVKTTLRYLSSRSTVVPSKNWWITPVHNWLRTEVPNHKELGRISSPFDLCFVKVESLVPVLLNQDFPAGTQPVPCVRLPISPSTCPPLFPGNSPKLPPHCIILQLKD